MGVSDEAMKPMSVPEDIKRAAIEKAGPQIGEISRKMIFDLEEKLCGFKGGRNNAATRAAIKKNVEDYLEQLKLRGFLTLPKPVVVTIVGEDQDVQINIDPNPFLEPPHAQE